MSLASVMSRPDIWRGDRLATAVSPTVSSGFDQLDAALPGGGWPRGVLIELLLGQPGIGELELLMPALARIKADGGWSMLIAPPHLVHAPAWAAAGIDLSQLLVVCPRQPNRTQRADIIASSPGERDGGSVFAHAVKAGSDVLWAFEQALASGVPQAVVSWCEQAQPRQVRRLQVAATTSTALAFLFRPLRAAAEASAAPLRLRVTAGAGGTLTLDILKRRGPPHRQALHIAVPRPAPLPREFHHVPTRFSSMAGHSPAAAAARSAPAPVA